ncbi:MAG: helix-turn-helix transcriptional regulator [Oligoflexales bacterium]|nr:helix-turn-helix transcriptional regulator [Oligoflexales bacterium]
MIKKNFDRILEERNSTYEAVAEKGGLSHRSIISRAFKGNATIDTLSKIARGLDIPLWQLFIDEDAGEFPLNSNEKKFVAKLRKIRSTQQLEALENFLNMFMQ